MRDETSRVVYPHSFAEPTSCWRTFAASTWGAIEFVAAADNTLETYEST